MQKRCRSCPAHREELGLLSAAAGRPALLCSYVAADSGH